MANLKKLLNNIISIVDDENLPDWEQCHLEILKTIENNGFKVSRNIENEITSHYFNACKITYFKFCDFVYNYLELADQEKKDVEFYIEKNI